MERYTLQNDKYETAMVMASSHRQHIWHTSHIAVSAAVKSRVERKIGRGPYTPVNCCGRARVVHLEQK